LNQTELEPHTNKLYQTEPELDNQTTPTELEPIVTNWIITEQIKCFHSDKQTTGKGWIIRLFPWSSYDKVYFCYIKLEYFQ